MLSKLQTEGKDIHSNQSLHNNSKINFLPPMVPNTHMMDRNIQKHCTTNYPINYYPIKLNTSIINIETRRALKFYGQRCNRGTWVKGPNFCGYVIWVQFIKETLIKSQLSSMMFRVHQISFLPRACICFQFKVLTICTTSQNFRKDSSSFASKQFAHV